MSMPRQEAATVLRAVRVNGVELHYTDTGTDGGAVILLHGGMGDLGAWDHQQRALRTRFRVLAYSRRYSHPNQNRLPRAPAVHTVDDDVDDFLALQAALGAGPAHLVATSYGALLALAIALRAPSHVASLVLAEPPLHAWARATPGGKTLYDAFMRGVWRAAGEAFEQGRPRRAMQILSEGMWGRPVIGSWSSERIDVALRNAPAMQVLTRSSDPFPDLDRAAVSRLSMPSLLIHGERTSALHRQVMDALGQVMRRAKCIEIANAGHGSPNESPEAFNAAVVHFLEALRPSSGVAR
jgi:pimeloyl-ACP methyl ester carboxylesterase